MSNTTVGTVEYDVKIKIQSFTSEAAKLDKAANDAAKKTGDAIDKETQKGVDAAKKNLENLKESVQTAAKVISASVIAGTGIAIKSAASYESSLSKLKYASSATSSEIQQMSALTRQLGNDTDLAGVTAADAALTMVELSKAGLSVKDTMNASKATMSLARAGNVEFAEAAVIAASALNAFNMRGDEAVKVADALAAGANASQAELSDLALGMQQSATVSKQFKLSLNDNVTALALFANNGIKGSDAGTSLKTMLIALAKPAATARDTMREIGFSAYNSKGEFVGLREMSIRLSQSLKGLTDQQKQNALASIFGNDAFRAAAILADNAGASYDDMARKVGQAGAAQKAAASALGESEKKWEKFKNSASELGLKLGGTLLPVMNKATDGVTKFVDALNDGNPAARALTYSLVGLAGALAVSKTIGTVATGLTALNTITRGTAAATAVGAANISKFGGAISLLPALTNPWVLGIGAAALGIGILTKKIIDSRDKVDDFGNSTANATKSIHPYSDSIADSVVNVKNLGVAIENTTNKGEKLNDMFSRAAKNAVDDHNIAIEKQNRLLKEQPIIQERLKAAQEQARIKQQEYNDAIAKYGENSYQAEQKSIALQIANDNLAVAMNNSIDITLSLSNANRAVSESAEVMKQKEQNLTDMQYIANAGINSTKDTVINFGTSLENTGKKIDVYVEKIKNVINISGQPLQQAISTSVDILSNGIKKAEFYQKTIKDTALQASRSATSIQSSSGVLQGGSLQGRYTGGPVSAGVGYIVGENPDGSLNKTSELFIPNQSGYIYNSEQLRNIVSGLNDRSVFRQAVTNTIGSGQKTNVFNQTNNIYDGVTVDQVNRSLMREARRAV